MSLIALSSGKTTVSTNASVIVSLAAMELLLQAIAELSEEERAGDLVPREPPQA